MGELTPITPGTVTPDDVKAIFQTSLTDPQLQAFINAAQIIYDANLDACGYDATTEAEIVRWLAAHLASSRDQRAKSVAIGSVSKSFHGNSGTGLDSTPYGQMVKLFDTQGKLVNLGKVAAFVEVGYEVTDA